MISTLIPNCYWWWILIILDSTPSIWPTSLLWCVCCLSIENEKNGGKKKYTPLPKEQEVKKRIKIQTKILDSCKLYWSNQPMTMTSASFSMQWLTTVRQWLMFGKIRTNIFDFFTYWLFYLLTFLPGEKSQLSFLPIDFFTYVPEKLCSVFLCANMQLPVMNLAALFLIFF